MSQLGKSCGKEWQGLVCSGKLSTTPGCSLFLAPTVSDMLCLGFGRNDFPSPTSAPIHGLLLGVAYIDYLWRNARWESLGGFYQSAPEKEGEREKKPGKHGLFRFLFLLSSSFWLLFFTISLALFLALSSALLFAWTSSHLGMKRCSATAVR